MNRDVLRTAACAAAACFSFSAANAHEPLARIHDEQTGAAALTTAFHMTDRLSWEMGTLVNLAQDKADRVLKQLSTLTTPSALRTHANGIEVPCETSGHYTAKLTAPRHLNIEWQECVHLRFGVVHTLNGPARIGLLGDSFATQFVGEIRLGTRSRDVVETLALTLVPDELPTIHTYNSTIRGLISMQRDPIFERIVGPFAYRVDGFFDEVWFPYDTSGNLKPTGFRLTADDVIASGNRQSRTTDSEILLDTSTRFVDGAITYAYRSGDERETQYQTFDQLSVETTAPAGGGSLRSIELNGGTSFFHNESAGAACLDGRYLFTTVSPLQLTPGTFDPHDVQSGELRVNNALTATFAASDPRLTMLMGTGAYALNPTGGMLLATARCSPL